MEYKDYIILEENFRHRLMLSVADMLKNNWIPVGGVSVCISGYRTYYYQAMVKVK
jgi:hypothetical protein